MTKAVKIYAEHVVAHQVGLLGMWAAEDVIGVIDEATGKVSDERRTDITYGSTDAQSGFSSYSNSRSSLGWPGPTWPISVRAEWVVLLMVYIAGVSRSRR